MVANYWSNDVMVTIHRSGLVVTKSPQKSAKKIRVKNDPPPLGIFQKIHPYWGAEASLLVNFADDQTLRGAGGLHRRGWLQSAQAANLHRGFLPPKHVGPNHNPNLH